MKSTTTTAAAKFGKQKNAKSNIDFEAKIERALTLKDTLEALKSEYDEIKQLFLDHFKDDTSCNSVVTAKGACILKLANSYSVLPEKMPELSNIFGDFLPNFVNEKRTFGATAELKKLLANADYEHINTIREAVQIKTTPSVDFQALNA